LAARENPVIIPALPGTSTINIQKCMIYIHQRN
jgi:hypothetical protein